MPNSTRELLLTTKAAQQWKSNFDLQVDAIIQVINHVDNTNEIVRTTEVLDVYHHSAIHASTAHKRRSRVITGKRPFEFLTFRN